MPCVLTQGYNLDCRFNFGGVREIFVIEFENVTAITEAAGVISAITKAATKTFKKYNLIAHTAEADEALAASREMGTLTNKQTIKFPINKMTTAVRNELLLLAQNRLIFVFVDENGTGWMYGRDYGLMLDTSANKTGRLLADRNGYELAFSGDERNLAYEVNSTALGTLTT
jgi:hypothetical protein